MLPILQTPWPGMATPDLGFGSTTYLQPLQVALVLSDIPNTPTTVQLSAQTMALLLWTPSSAVQYAIDATPGVLTVQSALTIDFGLFQTGGMALAGLVQPVMLPDTDQPHTLVLMSADASVYVLVQAFLDGGG